MKIFVGAYAALAGLDLAAEGRLYDGLAALGVAGLEHPFTGTPHRDELWFAAQIRPDWSIVLTTLPGTMERLQDDRHFGLASADAGGRERALGFLEDARRHAAWLDATLGRPAVRAVMIHSAPRLGGSGAKSSLERFADSLSELRGWDWGGAALLVEHCDAALPGRAHDKGFLSVEDDVLAAKLSSGAAPIGVAVNWGRSAVETRSAEGPLEHVARAREAGLLQALFFSGAIASHPDYGDWRDSHAPFSTTLPGSLLTPAAARAALAAAGDVPLVGLKLQTKPASLPVSGRLAVIKAGLEAIGAS